MVPVSLAMLILGWCSLLYGVTEMINSMKFYSDKRKLKQAQEIPVAKEIIEEAPAITEATEATEEDASPDDNLPVTR
jgi:hypothetical protein